MLAALVCAAMDVGTVRAGARAETPPSSATEGAAPATATESAAGGSVAFKPPGSRKRTNKPAMTGVLNVNRATEAELRLLPGIGKRRAQLIIERREKKPFGTVDEIGRIKGMRALVQRLRARLAVQGDTTLRPVLP